VGGLSIPSSSDFLSSSENDLALFCAPPTGFIPVEANVFKENGAFLNFLHHRHKAGGIA
jgi:hypothetical protein